MVMDQSRRKATHAANVWLGSAGRAGIMMLLSLSAALATANDRLLSPSGMAETAPVVGQSFADYVGSSRYRLAEVLNGNGQSDYMGGYSASDAADMRAPFQWLPDNERCAGGGGAGAGKGFLLVHGLTDSPYVLRNAAQVLQQAYPCSMGRALLLPGHGTLPGDSLAMQYGEWQEAFRYGVGSFGTEPAVAGVPTQQLYLVGFSTGTSLMLDYLQRNPAAAGELRQDRIAGMILLSPAVQANSGLAFLTPLIRHVKSWMAVYPERDAARYESFSFNAAAEFYRLTRGMDSPAYAPAVPVMMAVSADDTTIDAMAARRLFCASAVKRRVLVWYPSVDEKVNRKVQDAADLQCAGIVEVPLATFDPALRTLNISHVGVAGSAADPHYGLDGRYRHCKEYDQDSSRAQFEQCATDNGHTVYGENPELLAKQHDLNDKLVRRGTFNPDFPALAQRMVCLVDETCPL